MISAAHNEYGSALKQWRHKRKLSQLELSLAANVSQRHISWLETGRSHPSREMVLRLCEAIELPLRERNGMLQAAGFAKLFSEHQLDAPDLAPVTEALNAMLEHHEPFPAIVLDRLWNVRLKNTAAERLFAITGDADKIWQAVEDNGEHNIARLTLHPNGLRQYIRNWHAVGPIFAQRLKSEALESADAALKAKYAELEPLIQAAIEENEATYAINQTLLPILPLEFSFGDLQISLFSVISTFGTAQDITTDELRVETFYPTNAESRAFFTA